MSSQEFDKLKYRLAEAIKAGFSNLEEIETDLKLYMGGPPKQRYNGGPAQFARRSETALQYIERADDIGELNEFVSALFYAFEKNYVRSSSYDTSRLRETLAKANSLGSAGYKLRNFENRMMFVLEGSERPLN